MDLFVLLCAADKQMYTGTVQARSCASLFYTLCAPSRKQCHFSKPQCRPRENVEISFNPI